MDNQDIAKEWFKIADTDLLSAEFLQKMRPVPLEIICYHCQQAAEKYLKGYLASQGESVKKTHDLLLLNNACQAYDKNFESIRDICLMLTDFGVIVRYPYQLEINEADMALAIKNARQIQQFVTTSLM